MPRPTAWASGVALFVFAAGVRTAFALAMPLLILLMRVWPRLAWLGILLLWLSPVSGAAAIHGVVGRLIGATRAASRDAWFGGATSWWAGFVAWAAIIVVSVTMGFLTLVLNPPPLPDPDCVRNFVTAATSGGAGTVHSLIWILLAAYVYELELRARKPDASSG
jgi:hypothetical protein